MLRKLLAGSAIEMQGFSEGRERGYKFRGELILGQYAPRDPGEIASETYSQVT